MQLVDTRQYRGWTISIYRGSVQVGNDFNALRAYFIGISKPKYSLQYTNVRIMTGVPYYLKRSAISAAQFSVRNIHIHLREQMLSDNVELDT